jgi:hypothetical protein
MEVVQSIGALFGSGLRELKHQEVQKPSAVICGVLVFLSFGIAMESFLWM